MLRQRAIEALVHSWRGRGPLPCLLWPLSALFLALQRVRKLMYRTGMLRAIGLPVPVIVVGNFVAGGAGKTPTVLSLVQALRDKGWRPGIVSRGHGRTNESAVLEVTPELSARECGDEPFLLRLRATVPVVVGADRVAAARHLLERHPSTNVLVCDDGLQHLRLARDAQLVVFDERGAGNGWVLPAGPLREPLPRGVPARTQVVYNASRQTTPWPGSLAKTCLQGAVALRDWWQGMPADPRVLQSLAQRRVIAAAGMARPERFFDMLRDAGLSIDPLPLPDHYAFDSLPWSGDAIDVVVTEKDAVKLDPAAMGSVRVWVAPLDFRLPDELVCALERMARSPDGHPPA